MSKRSPGLEELSDEEVRRRVEDALRGDRAAMEALVADLAPVVHVRVARAMTRRRRQAHGRDLRHDLEDLVQDVFAALFAKNGRALRTWDPARGLSFTGFVGFLAEREVAMAMRSGKRNPWTEDPTADVRLNYLSGSDQGVESRLQSRDLLARISERLREKLTPRGRQYFQLIYVENRPVQDVATRTGTTAAALYAWRSRLTKLLRELRKDLEAEEGSHV